MKCYNCGCQLSEKEFCTGCGADVALYKKIMYASNFFYNEGLEKASVRDLSGAVASLRQSLKFNKNNVEARNLLGLVYFEMGEVVKGLGEWVISKNLRSEKNIADDYINMIQENPSRLETINQTIKKYNLALGYCQQDGLDLAVIQLKKVLSLNPNYIRAHQLLALLYMKAEEWEKAKRELDKCIRIDTGNTTTRRYLKEVEAMLDVAENARGGMRKKALPDDVVKYQSGNETIIQPVGNRDNRSVSTVLNIGIGIVIGIAAACFLILPSRLSSADSAAQAELRAVSEQLDKKTSTIEEMEQQAKLLTDENEKLKQELNDYVGNDGALEVVDGLLQTVSVYMENPEDTEQIAQSFEKIDMEAAGQVESERFQNVYQALLAQVGPSIASSYYEAGLDAYQKEMYEEAITNLTKAAQYDQENGDILYNLANAYRQNGDTDEAIEAYTSVVTKFEGTERARRAQKYLEELNEG
ncbi:MAG: tetratricopeptide repeat protein [Lachnospiraceae bacterium]|nr:tetratricopeptide repeat protein [Lachnospiraceae bacterium]